MYGGKREEGVAVIKGTCRELGEGARERTMKRKEEEEVETYASTHTTIC